jgi:hypothetical protein
MFINQINVCLVLLSKLKHKNTFKNGQKSSKSHQQRSSLRTKQPIKTNIQSFNHPQSKQINLNKSTIPITNQTNQNKQISSRFLQETKQLKRENI